MYLGFACEGELINLKNVVDAKLKILDEMCRNLSLVFLRKCLEDFHLDMLWLRLQNVLVYSHYPMKK